MKTSKWASVLAVCVVCAWGCDQDKPKEGGSINGAETKDAPAATNGAKGETNSAKKDAKGATNAETNGAKTDTKPGGDGMEVNPAATDTVKLVDLKGKAPEQLEVKGKLLDIWGWTDKGGMNVFVVSSEKRASKVGESVALIGRWAYQEGDASWSDVRVFTEIVADCDFDITLEHQKGDWVIKDLTGDGNAEVTFAYHAGCRSDVSPVDHKVLIAAGDKKFAIRGQTAVAADGKNYEGGDYKKDGGFAKAPKGLRGHAEKVWEMTVKEKM